MLSKIDSLQSLIEEKDFTKAFEIAQNLSQIYAGDLYISLLEAIKQKDIQKALQIIKQIKSQLYNSENVDVVGLQTTVNLLKTQLLVLTNQKTEIEKLISQFRIRYYQELGFLISDILKLRLETFSRMRDKNPDVNYEYEKSQEQFNKFYEQWEKLPKEKVKFVDKKLKQKITHLYRKATKLCHPDIVSEKQRDKAERIFVKLHKAYVENDLETLENIYEQLENGILQADEDDNNNIKFLQAKILQLKQEITLLRSELNNLKNSETYNFISKLNNWDEYFNETKKKLQDELNELKKYAESIASSKS